MKERRSGKSKSSMPWPKGKRNGCSWAVDWAMTGKIPKLQKNCRYEMIWLGGRNVKLVQVTTRVKRERR